MDENAECDGLESRLKPCYHKVIARKEKDLYSNEISGDYLKDGYAYNNCATCDDNFNYVCENYTPYD